MRGFPKIINRCPIDPYSSSNEAPFAHEETIKKSGQRQQQYQISQKRKPPIPSFSHCFFYPVTAGGLTPAVVLAPPLGGEKEPPNLLFLGELSAARCLSLQATKCQPTRLSWILYRTCCCWFKSILNDIYSLLLYTVK